MTEVRKTPCKFCPYRCDVPSGVWAPEEYAKLPKYDRQTPYQPPAVFVCHAAPEKACHGWAVVHTSRGHKFDLLALRLSRAEVPEAAVPLFESGAEAAKHGFKEILSPKYAAARAMATLKKYKHIKE